MTTDVSTMMQQNTSAWNNKETRAIRTLLKTCWAEAGTYADPNLAIIQWRTAMVDLIVESYVQLRNRPFRILFIPELHHNYCHLCRNNSCILKDD